MDEHPPEIKKTAQMWSERRKMAWLSFYVLIAEIPIVLVAALYNPPAISAAAPVLASIGVVLAGIIGAWYGFSTVHDKWSK